MCRYYPYHVGMSQVFVMQPFEIIKVRLQTQPKDAKVYNGIIDCLFKIIKNEGPFALYKGIFLYSIGTLTPLMGVGLLGSIRFGLFEGAKKRICEMKNIHPSQLDLQSKSMAALFAGFFNSFVLVLFRYD